MARSFRRLRGKQLSRLTIRDAAVAIDKLVSTFNLHAQKEKQPQITLNQHKLMDDVLYDPVANWRACDRYDYIFATDI